MSSVVALPPSLAKDPPYALEACLDGVAPASGSSWPEDACNAFADQAMADSCTVTVSSRRAGGSVLVCLDRSGEMISDLLIQGKAEHMWYWSCAAGLNHCSPLQNWMAMIKTQL